MSKCAFLLDKPEDYKRLGINPDCVEKWEDGIRDTSAPNHFEWWYFDCMLQDGTKIVIQFLSKSGRNFASGRFHPTLFYKVTLPDGRQIDKEIHVPVKQVRWSETECDVQYGKHYARGDLKRYELHIEPIDGMGADLIMESESMPYRPGTAYFQFEDADKYYTWLCVVPKGRICGTITVDGEARAVSGTGYHDHQWGSINFHKYWNHWIWARQSYEDYSLLLFDFFTNDEYGNRRFPIVFVQDSEGRIVFESYDDVSCQADEQYADEASGKIYPAALTYTFRKNGTTVRYRLKMDEIIEAKGKNNLPWTMKLAMKMMKIDASYSRYTAHGRMEMDSEGESIVRENTLIYEIMCPGAKMRGTDDEWVRGKQPPQPHPSQVQT